LIISSPGSSSFFFLIKKKKQKKIKAAAIAPRAQPCPRTTDSNTLLLHRLAYNLPHLFGVLLPNTKGAVFR
jgi:hypothetical protein